MQIFPRSLNKLPVAAGAGLTVLGVGVVLATWYWASPYNTQVGYAPVQPVAYSHQLHAGQLGIDCRYCHANIERSAEAMIPPTQTCMGCHAVVRKNSPLLRPVRESWRTGKPIRWVRVHKLPEHAYFDHSVHLAAGVGCSSCHGRIDQMPVVTQAKPLSMGWCLECHRNPGPNIRPRSEITNMEWQPDPSQVVAQAGSVQPPQHCSGCHR